MTPEDAQEYTESLGQIAAGSWRQVALGERLGVPAALGITTREWVEQRLGGYVRLAVPERREAAAELTSEGMSQRRVAEVLGVSHETVRRDVGTNVSDEPVAEEQPQVSASAAIPTGINVPAEPPYDASFGYYDFGSYDPHATPADLAAALGEFPELSYYAEDGRDQEALRIAASLRGYEPAEQDRRRTLLARTIEAEKTRPEPKPSYDKRRADAIFSAANTAAQAITKNGGPDTVGEAVAHTDPLGIDNWRQQFLSLAALCTDLAEVCRPSLRRLK